MDIRIKKAQKGEIKLFFVDAAHFVLGAFLGYVWSFVRIFIKTPSGRSRYNILGALDAITKEIITITNTSYINSTTICELLEKLFLKYPNTPITIVLDNAKYQKCTLVTDLAKKLGIELLYLPTYSPNLNLIERVWKFTKKKCLYSVYYDSFLLFKSAIDDCMNKINGEYKEEISTLLTLNFQTF